MKNRVLSILAALLPATAASQSFCTPASDTPEAKMLAFFAGPLALSAVPDVAFIERGVVKFVGELALLPNPPASITRSSGACGFAKSENTNLSPIFPRPRLAIGLGGGLVAEVSYMPPINVADASPHMGGVALSWTPALRLPVAEARLTLRAHITTGGIDGPITCPKKALQLVDSMTYCYGRQPSDDTYEPGVRGVEAIVSGSGSTWDWHAGAGFSALRSRLKVEFIDGNFYLDNNIVEIDLTRFAILGGVSRQIDETLAVSAQVYSVPGDATTARLGIAWRVR